MRKAIGVSTVVLVLFVFASGLVLAAPFDKITTFTQPDGAAIQLHGWGDEFHAVFETLDGYTVVFDHAAKAYCYAGLSPDGQTLVPTALRVGGGDPAALGLEKHLRAGPEAVEAQVSERRSWWEKGTRNAERWAQRKARLHPPADGPLAAPPATTTTGEKKGLCLLIDFSDEVGTIPQANIDGFCNGDSYTGYGNNGSVKKYYSDVSNGTLTYTNVVTAYIRVPYPKSYYNDISEFGNCGTCGNLLVRDAIAAMKALPNYDTEILPLFADLTVDGSNQVVATNVFFAGDNSDVWMCGLWPHSWSLYEVGAQSLGSGAPLVWNYQITDIGSSLTLGTFCHENGHMLCDFPDLYDYDYDSVGGAGYFCLMSYGGDGPNPVQVCAYLKYAAGWTTITELDSSSELTATLASAGDGFNHFYRYAKPGVDTEYYLLENRQKAGRDATLLPASGIAVWHVDELGDRDNQSLAYNSSHQNYEVTLVQADNLWHFQNYVNAGDANDLYYLGNTGATYSNTLTDVSSPAARWWNWASSGLVLTNFSANGTTMTVEVGGEAPAPLDITTDTLPDGLTGTAYSATLAATGGNEPYTWSMVPAETLSAAVVPSGGMRQYWRDDDECWSYTLPFSFPYMGRSYTSVYVCSNGYLDFANAAAEFSDSASGLAANVRIAPFWSDLRTDGSLQAGEDIYIRQPDADSVAFRWVAEDYGGDTRVNFEVILRRDGGIVFHYGTGNANLAPTIGLGGGPSVDAVLSAHNGELVLANASTSTFGSPLHTGLSLNASTGEISGTPAVSGSRDITFFCESSDKQLDSAELTLFCQGVPRTLSINSTPLTGVAVTSVTGHGGSTNYQLTVDDGTVVALTAPATAVSGPLNCHFSSWSGTPPGTVFSDTNRTITFTLSGDLTLTAQYLPDTWTLRVQSLPATGVVITSSTGHGGTTNYQRTVDDNSTVNLTAPESFNGQFFKRWQNGSGVLLSETSTYETALNANLTAVAVYSGLRVTTPSDAGITFMWGQKKAPIRWSTILPVKTPLKVTLYDSHGGTWDLGTAAAGAGVFYWNVGAWKSKTQAVYPQADDYRIRVSMATDETVEDSSDSMFAIGSVTSLQITGATVNDAAPAELPCNTSAQFTCKGICNFGDPQDVTPGVKWTATDPLTGAKVKIAKMGKTGILAVGPVAVDTQIRLTAMYGKAPKGGTAPTGTMLITIKAP